MNRLAITSITLLTGATGVFLAEARPMYARNENRPCGYCHVRISGGGERGFRGQFYGANGLRFDHFKEEREALIAGLTSPGEGRSAIPAVSYVGKTSGPAAQQIQLASLRGPVVVLFLDKADEPSKIAVKALASLAKAYGNRTTFLGVAKSSDTVKLTDDLGGLVRVLPDPDAAAVKKFGASQALDIAVVAKLGDPLKTFAGFCRTTVESAMKELAGQGIPQPEFDLKTLPEKLLRGSKL